MHHGRFRRRGALAPALVAVLAACLLSACGSSSTAGGSAQSLLRQTFSGSHKVKSGNLQFTLSVNPSGSSTLTKPISLAFGGPFQSLGTGKLPQSNFTVSISAQGHTGTLSILSTGTKGFVTLSGTSYQLPAASFQKLESSFSSIASSGGAGGSGGKAGTLSKLGIDPLHWLSNPSVVGADTIGGTATTHIRARINVTALLRDLSTFLQRASSLGVSGTGKLPSSLSAATQTRIAGEVRSPNFDVWTGNGDRTVRKLSVGLTVPVSGQLSTLLGGLSSAVIGLTLQYTDLNQAQSIAAPTNVQPYSVFSAKLASLLQTVQSAVSSGALGSTTGTGTGSTGSGTSSTGSGTSSTGAAGASSAYGQCVQNAAGDIAKMGRCAAQLSNGG